MDSQPEKSKVESKAETAQEESTEKKEQAKKAKIKLKYKLQFYLGLAGGITLFLVGATGSAGFYQLIISYAIERDILASNYGVLALFIFGYLASGGGLTVIAGTFVLQKIRRFGVLLIHIGAGVSLFALIIKIYFIGAILQTYIPLIYQQPSYLLEVFRLIGIEIGGSGAGVLVSFLATFRRYRWSVTLGFMSLCTMFAGLSGDPRIFTYIRGLTGIPQAYVSYLDYLLIFILNIGAVLLVASILVGTIYKPLCKIIVLVCLIASILIVGSIILDILELASYTTPGAIMQYLRVASMIFVYHQGITFLKTKLKYI